MQVKSTTRQHLFLVVYFALLIPVFSDDPPTDHTSFGSGDGVDEFSDVQKNPNLQTMPCLETIQVTVAILPWPPYATNDNSTDEWQVKMIDKLNTAFLKWKNTFNVTFIKTQNQEELNKLFKMNKTDIGFPVIKQNGRPMKNFYHLGYRSKLYYLVAPNTQSPSEVCINTLSNSWPLLALSLIFSGIAGIVIWLLEMLSNREEFPSSFARGSWEGFWWAFISMTTVGYGDKCPRSVAGRFFAVLWIFAGVILVAVFMANVTTALTSASVKQEYNLDEAEQVGVVKHSLEEIVAKDNGVEVMAFDNHSELMGAFAKRSISGIIIDNYTASPYFENMTDSFLRQIQYTNLQNKHQVVAASSEKYERKSEYYYKAFEQYLFKNKYIFDIFSQAEVKAWDNTWLTINQAKYEKFSENHKKTDPLCFILGEVMAGFSSNKISNQDFEGIENGSPKPLQSFNLFNDSKEGLERATYLLLGILAGLIVIGLIMDKIFFNVKTQETEDYELKVHKCDDTMQDIAKGKEMLNQLQLFLQKMEHKIDQISKLERKKYRKP